MRQISLRERAIRYLAQREHSRAELVRKLENYGERAEIDETLARLTELGLLSDTRFAHAWVRSKAAKFGRARLSRELARRGIDEDTIAGALSAECGQTDKERAHMVWKAKFTHPPADAKEWAKQARFLYSRGFSTDIIHQLLKNCHDESA